MQSFRPLQRHAVSQWGTRALGHSRVARIWPGQRRGQINWVETLRYKHLFRTGIPGFLFTLSLLYLDNELYADPLSGLAGSTVYTTGLNLSLCGLSWGDNTGTLTSDQAWWPPWPRPEWGRSGGPARGLLLSNEVLLQLILPSLGRSQPRQWQTISINYFSIPLHPQYYLPFQCSTIVLNDT